MNPPVTLNAEITLEPSELVAGGDALAKVDGFPVFVPNVYPGDVARVRIVEVKKGFARGELVRLERPSALRRAAPCPIADECGGCDWTALRLDAQLAAKEQILRATACARACTRMGNASASTQPAHIASCRSYRSARWWGR